MPTSVNLIASTLPFQALSCGLALAILGLSLKCTDYQIKCQKCKISIRPSLYSTMLLIQGPPKAHFKTRHEAV